MDTVEVDFEPNLMDIDDDDFAQILCNNKTLQEVKSKYAGNPKAEVTRPLLAQTSEHDVRVDLSPEFNRFLMVINSETEKKQSD